MTKKIKAGKASASALKLVNPETPRPMPTDTELAAVDKAATFAASLDAGTPGNKTKAPTDAEIAAQEAQSEVTVKALKALETETSKRGWTEETGIQLFDLYASSNKQRRESMVMFARGYQTGGMTFVVLNGVYMARKESDQCRYFVQDLKEFCKNSGRTLLNDYAGKSQPSGITLKDWNDALKNERAFLSIRISEKDDGATITPFIDYRKTAGGSDSVQAWDKEYASKRYNALLADAEAYCDGIAGLMSYQPTGLAVELDGLIAALTFKVKAKAAGYADNASRNGKAGA